MINLNFKKLKWVLILFTLGMGALFVAYDVPLYFLALIIIITLSYTYNRLRNLW